MSGNFFGRLFRVATFGESHGTAFGCVLDGVPAGLALSVDAIMLELARRRPGQSALVTARQEQDECEDERSQQGLVYEREVGPQRLGERLEPDGTDDGTQYGADAAEHRHHDGAQCDRDVVRGSWVDEGDVDKIKVNQTAYVKSISRGDEKFEGTVTNIAPTLGSARIGPRGPLRPTDVEVMEVTIELQGTAAALKPGMRVDAFFRSN